jgi:branched-chain amino acid transport system permease protein
LNLLGETTRGLLANAPGLNLIVYGVVLVAMISFLPRGLAGLKR